jgi:hypothetical protein
MGRAVGAHFQLAAIVEVGQVLAVADRQPVDAVEDVLREAAPEVLAAPDHLAEDHAGVERRPCHRARCRHVAVRLGELR